MTALNRRKFLAMLSAATAGTAVAPLGNLYARSFPQGIFGQPTPGVCIANGVSQGFGPIVPKLPLNAADLTDTVVGNLSQAHLLELPENFSYTALSITGQIMGDGSIVPGDHDGMACFMGQNGDYVLVRNHELSRGQNKYGNRTGCQPPNGKVYDPFNLPEGQGGGGTSTLIIDRQGQLVMDYISLGGTIRNCAGGPTPWGSWISCEEDVSTLSAAANTKMHGYNFEVPALLGQAVDPIPLIDMGRFNHEAVACDPRTGYIYQTEDRGDSLFYRFVPHVRQPRHFGDLQQGGELYAMVIDAQTNAVCDGSVLPVLNAHDSVDTRRNVQSFLGQPLPVKWVKLEDVNPAADTLRFEGQAKGAAVFARGEGMWYSNSDGLVYFVATSGGDIGRGQVWAYNPKQETVTLLVESTDQGVLDRPDNITVGPDGALYLCEDGSGEQFVVGVDQQGNLFPFARNNYNTSEFAGACFSPDGRFMFVNMQTFGVTYAIFRNDHRPIKLNAQA